MREPHLPGPLPPRDWSEAFAALPSETPPADSLTRVFAQMPTSARRRSPRLPIALAASLLALACVPLLWRALPHAPSPEAAATRPDATTHAPRPTRIATVAGNTPPAAVVEVPVPPAETAQPERSKPVGIAKADTPRRDKPHRTRKPAPASDAIDKAALEPLYAESARLEALLAVASDDRAASATAVALGSDFEARVAAIDTALVQPSVSAQRRLALWRDRVSALRAYASFESTQRALAARGERYDAMLVSID